MGRETPHEPEQAPSDASSEWGTSSMLPSVVSACESPQARSSETSATVTGSRRICTRPEVSRRAALVTAADDHEGLPAEDEGEAVRRVAQDLQ